MAEQIAGRGDPIKTLQLMWQDATAPRRGPRPKVSVSDLVRAAIAIPDSEGLDAVPTRRGAEPVGIPAMAFYTHIPGKAELLDLMLDAVAGEHLPASPRFRPRDWRRNLSVIARGLWDFYMAHPWVLQVETHRPVIGPNTLRAADIALSAIEGCGLGDLEMDRVFSLVASYVSGAVRGAAREKRVKELTGMSDDEWWYSIVPFLETLDFSPYPVLARVGKTTGETYGA